MYRIYNDLLLPYSPLSMEYWTSDENGLGYTPFELLQGRVGSEDAKIAILHASGGKRMSSLIQPS